MKTVDADKHDRKKSLGGSEIAGVLGISPWTSPLQVWERKTGRSPEQECSEAMHFGNVLEDIVAKEFARRNNVKVVRTTKVLYHDDLPFSASIDRFILDGKSGSAFSPKGKLLTRKLLEIKTARTSKGWGEEGTDEIPPYYLTQLYWYLAISGCDVAHLAVLIGGSDYRQYVVERDESIIKDLFDKCTEWWVEYVEQDKAPPPRTFEDALKLYPDSNGAQITASEELEGLLTHQAKLKSKIKALTDSEKEIRGDILKLMEENEVATAPDGRILCTLKSRYSNRTDWKALVKEENISQDVIEKYTKVSATRTLLNKIQIEEV